MICRTTCMMGVLQKRSWENAGCPLFHGPPCRFPGSDIYGHVTPSNFGGLTDTGSSVRDHQQTIG